MNTTTTITSFYENSPVIRPKFGARKIYETLRQTDLSSNDYLLIGGAAMVLHGAKRRTPDVDILVSKSGWKQLLETSNEVVISDPPQRAIDNGAVNSTLKISGLSMPVEATENVGDGHYPLSFDEHRSCAELVGGVPCLSLVTIRDAKQALNRPGDFYDILFISSFLATEIK